MKIMTPRLLIAVFALGLCSAVLAQENAPRISMCGPGGTPNPLPRDQFIILVVEGPNLFYDTNPIPSTDVVDFVNKLLKTKGVSYIGVYARVGTKFGEVVQALDVLRKTDAKNIGVNMAELALGRDP